MYKAGDANGILPNAINAVIEGFKLTDYLLSPTNDIGKHKAELIKKVLGYEQKDYEEESYRLITVTFDKKRKGGNGDGN